MPLKALADYFGSIPAMFIDGLLYVLVAIFAALAAVFGSDDAAKYVAPSLLFWIKATVQALGAGCLAAKMFRSTAFADHQEQQKKDETKT